MYRAGRGARGATAFIILAWLSAVSSGKRVAAYCADISGAFYRVNAETLARKLRWQGMHESMLRVIESRLRERVSIRERVAAAMAAKMNSQRRVLNLRRQFRHHRDGELREETGQLLKMVFARCVFK